MLKHASLHETDRVGLLCPASKVRVARRRERAARRPARQCLYSLDRPVCCRCEATDSRTSSISRAFMPNLQIRPAASLQIPAPIGLKIPESNDTPCWTLELDPYGNMTTQSLSDIRQTSQEQYRREV
jgi:hypothetical protein